MKGKSNSIYPTFYPTQKKRTLIISVLWCPGQESNLHALRHTHLKRARLPIPPPGLLEIVVCKSNTFFSFTNYFYEKNLLAQEFVLKQKQIDDGDGDIGIGQVEDGSEKVVVAVHQEVQEPRYTVPLEEREIEHVDDLAHHESGVVSAEMCDRIGRRLREEQPVESAVDDIAQGTGHNQRQADDDPLGGVFAFVDEVVHQPADDPDHHDPENPEQEFPPVEPAFGVDVHPEGRAVIFDEAQLEPVREDDD